MISRWLLYSMVFLFAWMACLSLPVLSFAQEASTVRATQVDAKVTKNEAVLREGDVIQRGDRIVVNPKSAAVLTWSNGSILKIYPNSSITLRGVVFENDRKLEKTFLTLEKGRIFAKAQVPEHMFEHFEIQVANIPIIAQASEFALKYDETKNEMKVFSLLGRVVVDAEMDRTRIEEGQRVKIKTDGKPENIGPMPVKTQAALMKVSKRLGGSLLIEEESGSIGGPLKAKIGGVRNRRGDAPYSVAFKAIIKGGSGKIKSIQWDFGDGESAEGKKIQHTFTQGVYGVVLRVEDENGEKATSQINISVEEDCAC